MGIPARDPREGSHPKSNQQQVVPLLSCTAVVPYKILSNPLNFIRRSSFTKLNIEINHLQTWITQPTQDEFSNKPRNLKGDDFSWKSIFQNFFQILKTFLIKFQSRRNLQVSYVVQHLYNLENRIYMKNFIFRLGPWNRPRGAKIRRTKSMGSITCWTRTFRRQLGGGMGLGKTMLYVFSTTH